MSDDSGEKTEEPTDKKINDSREKGQIPPMKSAIDSFSLLFGAGLVWGLFSTLSHYLQLALDKVLALGALDGKEAFADLQGILLPLGFTIYAFAGGLALSTILFGLGMNGFNFSLEPLKPDVQKINPISGLKNIISMQSLVNLFRMLLFFLILAIALYFLMFGDLRTTMGNTYCGTNCIANEIIWKLKVLVALAIFCQIALSAFDIKLQTQIFLKKLKMTKDEVKRESKESNGDPLIKGQRMSIVREDATAPTPAQVTHVVHSSQHLVAIIEWSGGKRLPYVVMKAAGENVQRFTNQYKSMGKTLVYNPKVAREFFEMAVIGKDLPPRSGRGMAEIKHKADKAE